MQLLRKGFQLRSGGLPVLVCVSIAGIALMVLPYLALPSEADPRSTVPEFQTEPRFATAIASLSYRDREYVNTADNGREIQSAISFDGLGECYNPTEAGAKHDRGMGTSSQVLEQRRSPGLLEASTRMAFWLQPGEAYRHPEHAHCGQRPDVHNAMNESVISDYVVHKRVATGFGGMKNVIEYRVAFDVPRRHKFATFEAVTGYLAADFTHHLLLDAATGALTETTGRGEQHRPVILATPDGSHAMGVYSPELPQGHVGYGRFPYPGVTNKWNCVFRARDIVPGRYCYRCYIAVGTIEEVAAAIGAIHRHFAKSTHDRTPQAVCPPSTNATAADSH